MLHWLHPHFLRHDGRRPVGSAFTWFSLPCSSPAQGIVWRWNQLAGIIIISLSAASTCIVVVVSLNYVPTVTITNNIWVHITKLIWDLSTIPVYTSVDQIRKKNPVKFDTVWICLWLLIRVHHCSCIHYYMCNVSVCCPDVSYGLCVVELHITILLSVIDS